MRGNHGEWLMRMPQWDNPADAATLDRAQGCLLGQLAGDSLGGLVEFQSAGAIRQRHPLGVRDMVHGGTWGNLAGQATDDSELALMLARTLVNHGTYDCQTMLESYLHWWPLAWDRGTTLSAALGAAADGKTPAERMALAQRHARTDSQANGSLMRISPLGIFAAGRPAWAADRAREDSGLTHPHEVCRESCAAVVAAISHVIATGEGAKAAWAVALAQARAPAVVQVLRLAGEQPPADYQKNMGWSLIALQNAFYQALHAPSLEEGIVATIGQGGDTDTNAAIAGALLGAVHGKAGVPERRQVALVACQPHEESGTRHPMPREFWPMDCLELAEKLLQAGRVDGANKHSG